MVVYIVLNQFDYSPNNEARMEGLLLVLYRITCVIWVFPSSAHLPRLAQTFCLGSTRRYHQNLRFQCFLHTVLNRLDYWSLGFYIFLQYAAFLQFEIYVCIVLNPFGYWNLGFFIPAASRHTHQWQPGEATSHQVQHQRFCLSGGSTLEDLRGSAHHRVVGFLHISQLHMSCDATL